MGVPLVSLFYYLFLFLILSSSNVTAQTSSADTDFSCSLNSSLSCDTYVTYRAHPPKYFDVGSISDLLEVSRLSIAKAVGLATEDIELFPDQVLLVPVKCYCIGSQYFSNVTYQIKKGDSFYSVSIESFENLTNDHVVRSEAVFPLFCKCPAHSDLEKGLQYLITYVWQPWDDILPVIANLCFPVLIPLKFPIILQSYTSSASSRKSKHAWILITVLSIMGLLAKRKANLALNSSALENSDLIHTKKASKAEIMEHNTIQVKLLPGVSRYTGKPINMTHRSSWRLLSSSVRVVAVKKTKQASEELAILQKLNHANLVKLIGVSSDDQGISFWFMNISSSTSSASGSVVSLCWGQRLHIALDVANALQYLHEHTQPGIVHGDIRTCSIVLDSRFKAKIASFTAARYATSSMMLKIDAFASGFCCWTKGEALITWKEIKEILEVEDNREEKFRRWMDPKLSFYPVDDALNLASLATVCTSEQSAERPKMTDIVFYLRLLTQSSFEMYGQCWTSGEAEEIVQIVNPVIAR
ncbi:unnamed protein product [Withania somnifera]